MKKKLLASLFLAGLALLLSSCVQPSAPEVKYLDYKLGHVTPDGIEVNFNFEVSNPNPLPLDVTSYSYKVFINNNELVSADHKGFSLPASGKTRVSIQAVARYDQIFGTAASLLASMAKGINSFDYRVEGSVNAGALGVTVGTPFKASGTIPIPKDIKII
jgi:LEA14-like dessication related protein